MKVHIIDLLLVALICCTYWVHVQSHQAYPPGVPPPSGMPPQHGIPQHGVPPQHYQQQQFQQPPPQYQHAPPQMQYQQHPGQGQFQQPPPQMMQQQGQFQQPPVHQMQQQQFQQPPQQQHHGQPHPAAGHAHQGAHSHDFNKESHDREHIAEHLKDVVNKPVEQMTEEEMEFHYFKLHDYDNNNKLDGTEITKALTHFEREGHHDHTQPVRTLSDDEISEIVDAVLKEDDLNGDGYVEYSEFVVAQRKARASMPAKETAQEPPGGQH